MILRTAKVWARIVDDYKPLPENKRGPGRVLTPEEERGLFEIAGSNPNWHAAYLAANLAANTTARSCELRGLRLADIDLIGRTMTVRRATTKTDAGCRVIPLSETAAWALGRLVRRAQALGARKPEHYLFPGYRFRQQRVGQDANRSGYDPTSPMRTWRTAWRSLTRAIQCPACGRLQPPGTICSNDACKADIRVLKSLTAGLRFHDLRHHCITRLAEAGVPEQTLMAIAGHVSREMLEHYSHIRMQAKRDAVAALDPPPIRELKEQAALPIH